MADETKLEMVTVKAAMEDGRVALYETHKDNITESNKDGEVFVVGDGKVHKVALTPTVEQKLRDGVLVKVDNWSDDAQGVPVQRAVRLPTPIGSPFSGTEDPKGKK